MNKQIAPHERRAWIHRADNRERLIAAGYTVLAEKGYEATTVKEVARVAEVSPGLFHYYFASKDELLLEVIREAGVRYGARLSELRAAVPAADFPEAAVRVAQESVVQVPEWYRLRYELYALGLRKADFLPALGEQLAHIRREIAERLQGIVEGDAARMEALAAVVLACFDGLALQQLAEPDADLGGAYALLHELFVPGQGGHP